MKPARIKAEQARLDRVNFRHWIRRIPDNAKLINILRQFEEPFRSEWYRQARPHFRFEPISLETFNGLSS